jgi:hypothetical protein
MAIIQLQGNEMEDLEIEILRSKQFTKSKNEYELMRQLFPNRINIVAEGDSWFDYPKTWMLVGKPSNLIKHISKFTRNKANFLSLASNGDEAVEMVSGKQKHELVDILRWHENDVNQPPIDILLFSGGGNDLVGKNDFERFILKNAESCNTAKECILMDRLDRKIKQIGLAYQELLDIRDHYSPTTTIITHTYDYPFPSLQGGEFLGGLIKTKAWVKRFMDASGIKEDLQSDVIKIFMDKMAEEVLNIADNRKRFIVVDSRKTLVGSQEWLNEIHPTSGGFKKIARIIFKQMKKSAPLLA